MQQYSGKYFAYRRIIETGQIIYFCESSHVAKQIKENRAQSTMKANMLSLHIPSTPGVGSKGQIFFSLLKVDMLHTKLK